MTHTHIASELVCNQILFQMRDQNLCHFIYHTSCFTYPCTSTITELSQIVIGDDVMKYGNPGILVEQFLFDKIERTI